VSSGAATNRTARGVTVPPPSLLARAVPAFSGTTGLVVKLVLLGIANAIGLWAIVGALQQNPEVPAEALLAEVEAQDTRDLLAKLLIEERDITDRPAAIEQFRRRLERARRLRRLRSVSQTVAEAQSQAASSAVPMDSSYVVELHQEGAGVHELVGGAAQALSVPAIESEDPSRSQGVTTHE